jgi:hypothetical protein
MVDGIGIDRRSHACNNEWDWAHTLTVYNVPDKSRHPYYYLSGNYYSVLRTLGSAGPVGGGWSKRWKVKVKVKLKSKESFPLPPCPPNPAQAPPQPPKTPGPPHQPHLQPLRWRPSPPPFNAKQRRMFLQHLLLPIL